MKELIKKWHGGKISRLTVCRDSYKETNELKSDNLPLKDLLGIDGSQDKEQAPAVTLYYDFKPETGASVNNTDPIMMC